MATMPETQAFVETMLYLFAAHCEGVNCWPEDYDMKEWEAAWERYHDLGTEEVMADLSPAELDFFWVSAFAVYCDANDYTLFLNPWDVCWRLSDMKFAMQDGAYDNFIDMVKELADDPVLTDD